MRRWLLPVLVVLAPGCAYKATLSSTPPGATVQLPNGRTVVTPAEVKLPYRFMSFKKRPVRVYLPPRYRHLDVDLPRGGGDVHFTLIPDHGAAGEWTPDEVP